MEDKKLKYEDNVLTICLSHHFIINHRNCHLPPDKKKNLASHMKEAGIPILQSKASSVYFACVASKESAHELNLRGGCG